MVQPHIPSHFLLKLNLMKLSEINSNYTLDGGVGDSAAANLPKQLLKRHPEVSRVPKALTPFSPSFPHGCYPVLLSL